jgi:hypothetical protein
MPAASATRTSISAFGERRSFSETHILAHRHMRVERIILEHHGEIPFLGLDVIDDPSGNRDRAAADVFEASDHAQQRGLSAAGRTDQCHELTIGDIDVDTMHDGHVAVGFLEIAE